MTTGGKYTKIKEIFNSIEGVDLHDKKGGTIYYSMATDKKMRDVDIEVLELSVRAYHCMKRAGYNTIGDIIGGAEKGVKFSHIRNCGTKTAAEIMEKLFLWYLSTLPMEKRTGFILDTVEKNRKG